MSPVLPRRLTLGAGALLAVMLLVVAAAGLLAVYYADRADAERRAEDREAGRVFALWFQAAHRASQEFSVADPVGPGTNFTERVAGGDFLLTAAQLRGLGVAPPGLPDGAGRSAPFSLGIIDDGRGVPMAFGVLEPQAWAHTASLREGALEGGVAQLEDVSDSSTEMHVHVSAIEAALGRAPAAEALFVTADRGVSYRDRVLYRRAQPGHGRLNRMEIELDAGGCGASETDPCDVLDAGPVAAEWVSATPDPAAPVASTVGGDGRVTTRTAAGSMSVTGLAADPLSGTPAYPGDVTAREVTGEDDFTVAQDLVVGRSVSQAMSTGDMDVSGQATSGAVEAVRATAPTRAEVTGTGVLGLYAETANISTLTVGSCAGCYPE